MVHPPGLPTVNQSAGSFTTHPPKSISKETSQIHTCQIISLLLYWEIKRRQRVRNYMCVKLFHFRIHVWFVSMPPLFITSFRLTCKLFTLKEGTLFKVVKLQGLLWNYVKLWGGAIQATHSAQSLSNFKCKLFIMRRGIWFILGDSGKGKLGPKLWGDTSLCRALVKYFECAWNKFLHSARFTEFCRGIPAGIHPFTSNSLWTSTNQNFIAKSIIFTLRSKRSHVSLKTRKNYNSSKPFYVYMNFFF